MAMTWKFYGVQAHAPDQGLHVADESTGRTVELKIETGVTCSQVRRALEQLQHYFAKASTT